MDEAVDKLHLRARHAPKGHLDFGVLILSDVDRLGRDSVQTPYAILQLYEAGVRIFTYGNDEEVEMTGALATFQMQTQALVAALEREKGTQRTTDAMMRKAKAGEFTGGRVFGYTGHTINPVEAAVVRRIFALYDSGLGLKAMAKRLTAEGVVTPTPFVRRDPTKVLPVRGWSPTTIRGILRRELYRGVIVYNRSKKRNARGQVKQRPRPKCEWIRVPAEHLRIIPDDLWTRVAARRAETEGRQLRFADGRMIGRPPKQVAQNLLSGLATCAVCGGGLCVATSPRKRGRVPEYICSRRRVNGTCSNALRLPVAEVNEAVLHAIEEHVLTPEAVEAVIHLTERDDHRERQERLGLELTDAARRIPDWWTPSPTARTRHR